MFFPKSNSISTLLLLLLLSKATNAIEELRFANLRGEGPATVIEKGVSVVSDAIQSSSLSCIPKLGLRPLKSRDELPFLVEEHGLTSGIEIGVQEGKFADRMLTNWKSCKEYHLVDLWGHQENYEDIANIDDEMHDRLYKRTVRKMREHKNVTTIFHRMYSSEAVKDFEKESIDFIYVDARHDYCGVKEDIENYWPILKPGGIMAGHDYHENKEVKNQDWGLCGDGSRNDMAVKGAVNDFFLPKGYSVSLTGEDQWMSWIVQKRLC